MALLAAIVTGGFHCLSTYTWKSKEGSLSDEKDPIMYANCRGEFECEISTKVDGKDRKFVLTFCVTGKYCSELCNSLCLLSLCGHSRV